MLMHFFSRSEILRRFTGFAKIQIDELITTSENGKYTDYDYIVKASKSPPGIRVISSIT